ncbi:extensin-like domain-containing protein [Blastomonas aquatica]|uniref:Extensin n=1 Tax=Blastomonas aquatica TaxID=1510276 RepID=A0ABQ1JQW3_9SPHN|nr:extensin family protein [Blastomonas aquatica]GGB73317.1 extensin [Blastomonas aquatica]
MRIPNIIGLARRLIWLAIFVFALLVLFAWLRPGREDMPWTPLSLSDPIGMSTGRKVARLTGDRDGCIALLETSGLEFDALEPRGSDQCRVEDAIRLDGTQDLLAMTPRSVAPSCPVMIGMLIWQNQVVQAQAQEIFGQRVARIETFGSFSCRRMYGRSEGAWSEHARANAIDIGAFVLADGTRISVLGDWPGEGDKAMFLREVRDGACDLFSTVLSPEYNAAHADHFHFDMADRGEMGWRACR